MNTLKQYSRRSDDDSARQLKIKQTRVKQMETNDHQISSTMPPPPPQTIPQGRGVEGKGSGEGVGAEKKAYPGWEGIDGRWLQIAWAVR